MEWYVKAPIALAVAIAASAVLSVIAALYQRQISTSAGLMFFVGAWLLLDPFEKFCDKYTGNEGVE
jgi:hypothetical protein